MTASTSPKYSGVFLMFICSHLFGLCRRFVQPRDRDDSGLAEDVHALVPATVVVAPGPDDAVQQWDVKVVQRPLGFGDSLVERLLDRQPVVDDAAGPLGRLQRSFLVPDDTQHRVPGLAVVRREYPRFGERLRQFRVAVQREKPARTETVASIRASSQSAMASVSATAVGARYSVTDSIVFVSGIGR